MRPLLAILLLGSVTAYPWVVDQPGVDGSLLPGARNIKRQQPGEGASDPKLCPINPVHTPAAPYNPKYPYNNARNGLPGDGRGGFRVPAPGDTAHYFTPPGPLDIRGPCPGLNTLANHNFLAHDGITTFAELLDAQQNVYNVGYDLSVLLTIVGLTLGAGDPITNKLSIGCDATSRTSWNTILTGSEPGLNGHNKFEGDASLTRNDYFTHNGDDFTFNGTLFGMMNDVCNGLFDVHCYSKFRKLRFDQSRQENPWFTFPPVSLLLYGAASFVYALMSSGTRNYQPDLPTISSFFGAVQQANGSWAFNNAEQIPPYWVNRVKPYTVPDVAGEIVKMYGENPVVFGFSTGNGGYNGFNWEAIENGKLEPAATTDSVACALYQIPAARVPASFNGILTPTVEGLNLVYQFLSPGAKNLGCPLRNN